MDITDLLPIGTVVFLSGGSKRLMIYGRFQKQVETGVAWDYIGVPYPEGNISEEHRYLFNHNQIEKVVARGLDGEEEARYKELLMKKRAARPEE